MSVVGECSMEASTCISRLRNSVKQCVRKARVDSYVLLVFL